MRILLDECAPRPLKRELTDYEIHTVIEMGWSGKKNGELLRLIKKQESFTVLLTTDQTLRYQQNLKEAGVVIIVLIARSNRLSDLTPLVPDFRSVVVTAALGSVIEIGNSK